MLNDEYLITPRDDSSCDVRWTSPWPDGASWLFVNGKHSRGPVYSGTAERVVKIPLGLADVVSLEIHDFPDDAVVPDAVEIRPNTRPMIAWNAVSDAVRYRVYHRERSGAETLDYDRAASAGLERYEIACPVALVGRGGVWHFFRVEAVDEYGNESTRLAWTYFVTDLPPVPEHLSVAAGSSPGTYTFGLEE